MKGSRTIIRMTILSVIFLGISVAIYNGFVKDKTVVQTGNEAPDFVLPTVEGEQLQLSSLRGKGIVLNFWGTWCDPCKDEMPDLEKAYQLMKDKGIVVLAVNIGETEVSVKPFKNRYQLTFPIPMDQKKEITQLYGIGPIPTTYFIDKNGIVQNIIIGGPMSEQTITDNMRQIMP